MQDVMDWLVAHPGWASAIVFAVSFVESLVLVGVFVPGIVLLFGLGALIGLGVLEFGPIWLWGSLGAFLADFVSYQVGHRYREHLPELWPFSRYPGVLERGRRFFLRNGVMSVFAGRFIGPLRPFIPATVGMLGMRPRRFLAVDIPACVLWTPAYLLPGLLFGASLEVIAEYAGRLAFLLVAAVALLWFTWWLIWTGYEFLAARSARWLRHAIRWSRRHPVLGRVTGPLLDPTQPEVLSVTMLGLLLVTVLLGLVGVLFLGPFSPQPELLDRLVRMLAEGLRNHAADPWMVGIAELGRWSVLGPAAAAVLLWLLGARRFTAALHWLVAILGGIVLHLVLTWSVRAMPLAAQLDPGALRVPSDALAFTTVVTGFFAVMVARELPRRSRKWPYLASALMVSLLGFARIYLGLDWFSGAAIGLLLGLAWTAIVGIAYRQRALMPFSGGAACLIFYLALGVMLAWQVRERLPSDLAAFAPPTPDRVLAPETWWTDGWRELPQDRSPLRSVNARPFNLQAAAPLGALRQALDEAGWREVATGDWRWPLQAMNPEAAPGNLPLLPRDYLGRAERLLMQRAHEDPRNVLTLRLWESGFDTGAGQAIWLGHLGVERLKRRLRVVSYWDAEPAGDAALGDLRDTLAPHFEVRMAGDMMLLIRTPTPPGSAAGSPAAPAGGPAGR